MKEEESAETVKGISILTGESLFLSAGVDFTCCANNNVHSHKGDNIEKTLVFEKAAGIRVKI